LGLASPSLDEKSKKRKRNPHTTQTQTTPTKASATTASTAKVRTIQNNAVKPLGTKQQIRRSGRIKNTNKKK